MPRTQTDWPALKLEYINSTLSLRELADRHGIKASNTGGAAASTEE